MIRLNKKNNKYYTLCVLYIINFHANAAYSNSKYEFEPRLLNSSGGQINLEVFNQDSFQNGTYVVDIFVNGTYKKTQPIYFYHSSGADKEFFPCLEDKLLVSLGVKQSLLEKKNKCNEYTHHRWKISHNMYEQSLNISIPVFDLEKTVDGVAPKILWDNGINAAFVNYKVNAMRLSNKKNNNNQDYGYLALSPGFNFGSWRLRSQTIYTHSSSGGSERQTVNSYIERDLERFNSRVTIGDFITKNNIINSLNLRGISVSTDETMIPGRLRNNTPVIRGIARTPAYVEVEHNGYTIYTKSVEAGIFEFDDLPNVGDSGSYKVTIYESDGTKNVIIVPFARAPFSLKKGYSDYAINIGYYRRGAGNDKGPQIIDAGYSYGFSERVTLLSGIHYSNIYKAYAAGLSMSLDSLGVLSVESIYTKFKNNKNFEKQEKTGGAISLKYSKDFLGTGTNLYVANHTYNSKNYRTPNEVYDSGFLGIADYASRKHSLSVGLNQVIDNNGGIRISYNHDRYWDKASYQYFDVSYQGQIKGISYSLGYNEYITNKKQRNNTFIASIRVPFTRENSQTIFANYKYNNGYSSGETHSLGLSGNEFERSLSWNINQKYNNHNHYGFSGSAVLQKQFGYLGIGVSTDRNSSSYSADIGGGVLLSRHGVTLGQEIMQSTALLVADGAADVPITGKTWIKTNSQGRVLVSGLQPYRENNISLDPLQTPDNVEILQTDIKVIPTKGAIVEGRLKTNKGMKYLLRIITQKNRNVPFGSIVTIKGNNSIAGIVGDNGEVFLTGLSESGTLLVKWGRDMKSSCSVSFTNISKTDTHPLVCR